MSQSDAVSKDLERQILELHDRFSQAMRERLPGFDVGQKERYFVLISKLVTRLEEKEKPLKQVMQESFGELLPLVMAELQS